jgi:hypothetical protein
VEVAPFLFQEVGGQGLLAFRADGQGRVTAMFYGDQPIHTFQRLSWHQDPQVHLAGLGLALLIFAVTLVIWLLGLLLPRKKDRSTPRTRLDRWARPLAGGLIVLNLVIVALVVSVLAGDDAAMQTGYPFGFSLAGGLALLSGLGALALLACAVGAWRQRVWGFVGRAHYTLVAAAAVYFVWYLVQVNLLRLRF